MENSSHEITYHEIDLNMTTREGDPRDSAILNGVLRAQRVGSIEILSENSFDKKLEFLINSRDISWVFGTRYVDNSNCRNITIKMLCKLAVCIPFLY